MTSGLEQFAQSDRQREAVRALAEHGTMRKAGKSLGISQPSFCNLITRVKRQAALHGWSPEHDMVHPTSPVHVAKGTSTLYNEEGSPVLQWVKTSLKHDQMLAIMKEAADEMRSDIKPLKPTKKPTKSQLTDLLNLYVLTDAHFGMRSWAEETDANWDLEIAERTVVAAFEHLIANSPNSSTGFLLQLGDALHSDGLLPITPTSHHVLDSDGRFPKVVRTVIRVMRHCIQLLLAKHDRVVVLNAQGNHDIASSVWLQEWFSVLYEAEPRIQVVVSPKPYYAYKHGDVLLGAHHGHKRSKLSDLVRLFVDEFRELHGQTKRTYIHAGHYHSDDLFADGSTRAERHETLAARDAHATHGGYRAGRSMKCITYSTQAEIGRSYFYPEAL